jgi:glycosyltransferase involved in cell wall biosynthesis
MAEIAILLATYNGEKFICAQLDSIFNQSYEDWTIYVRDDGSTDNTVSIIKEYQTKYPGKIEIIQDNLGGLGCRDQFLHLLNVVDAKYYMFCDQDDVWLDNKIEKSITRIKQLERKYPQKAIMVGSDCLMCGPNLEVINESCWDHLRINPDKFLTKNGICVYPFVTGASMILNNRVKTILPKLPQGLPKNRPMYDWWVLLQVYKHGIVDLLHESTRYYRQHNNNVSGGIDKLDTSYIHKLSKIRKVLHANKVRMQVLQTIGYGSSVKYYFYKLIYLFKMMRYKHTSHESA